MAKKLQHFLIKPVSATFAMAFCISCSLLLSPSCHKKNKALNGKPFFQALQPRQTGLNFSNTLKATDDLDVFSYMYFYNGAGAAAGDFNNDGLIDVFFASNQGDNKIFLNEGGLHFKDVSAEANIPQDAGWHTGVSVVDINNDGLLDIYICKVGRFKQLQGSNQLLICTQIKDGIPVYEDQAQQYGLQFSGFSTQAAFFDYDRDGDLDMYLLNHAMHQDGSFTQRSKFLNSYDSLSGDRLFRNDNGQFTNETQQSGINSSAIGFGLGIAIADINMDGWPDLYIGNDFHENDYLYINQRDGSFKEEATQRLMHSSRFSMGVDIEDINNDSYPDIISMDMLAEDPYILKRSLGDEEYDVFYEKIDNGYSYQYSRNNFQLNRRNGLFSEIGMYAGMAATDWSWSPLLFDFDNDGWKDLFVANGIPKRLNDIDYVNFIYNREVQKQLQQTPSSNLVEKYHEIKVPNKFYKNKDGLRFEDIESSVENDLPTFSNGAVYADFDNDGDIDIIVNNINDPALLYENKHVDADKKNSDAIKIELKGSPGNINAIGTSVLVHAGNNRQWYHNNTVKGFMSSMMGPLHVGTGSQPIDSAFLIWPDGSFQKIDIADSSSVKFSYKTGLPAFDYQAFFTPNYIAAAAADVAKQQGLQWLHREDRFDEFNREPLMPHMVSAEGPAIAVADINGDGLEDVFIGAAKNFMPGLMLQQPNKTFKQVLPDCLRKDSAYEDVDAAWADVNNDGHPDLLVASGGNEFQGKDPYMLPRLYMNDGKGNFEKNTTVFEQVFVNASCIKPHDFDGDGWIDVFIGARNVAGSYGEIPTSYLLKNNGKGGFVNVTATISKQLEKAGLITDAVWVDVNGDGLKDLVVCKEWGTITAFINHKTSFTPQEITHKKGWWNCIKPVDIDGDGDMDFIAGNLGLNSRFKASVKEPVHLYYNDFDGNDRKEQVVTYYVKGREIPYASKDELQKQMPVIRKKYLYAEDFARADIIGLFSEAKIKEAIHLQADYFSNALLINEAGTFKTVALPAEAQFSSIKDATVMDANRDSLPDILLGGNYYYNNISTGRYDADYGTILINKGNGNFIVEPIHGVSIKGQVRKIEPLHIGKSLHYLVARNNDSTMLLRFK